MDPDNPPDDVQVVGDGEFGAYCPTCARKDDSDAILYWSDNRADARMEVRDHREWNPDHRPYARGPDGERVYS